MSTKNETTFKCDVCGDETIVAGVKIPLGWTGVTLTRRVDDLSGDWFATTVLHACPKAEPSCFRKLLIDIANADQKGQLWRP